MTNDLRSSIVAAMARDIDSHIIGFNKCSCGAPATTHQKVAEHFANVALDAAWPLIVAAEVEVGHGHLWEMSDGLQVRVCTLGVECWMPDRVPLYAKPQAAE